MKLDEAGKTLASSSSWDPSSATWPWLMTTMLSAFLPHTKGWNRHTGSRKIGTADTHTLYHGQGAHVTGEGVLWASARAHGDGRSLPTLAI
jgi:hypothetical protein